MAALILTLLGSFEARASSHRPIALPSRKAHALLAYLGMHPRHPQARDRLAALLWPDANDKQARQSLRQTLFALRTALAPIKQRVVRIEGDTVALEAGAVEVDATSFERLVATGTPPALEQAAALYRGDLLEGFTVGAGPFEDWLLAERERIRELAQEALGQLLAKQVAAGPAEPAIRTALRLLALDPIQEAVHRALMRLYARQGRRTAALRQYQVCVAVLAKELGVEPEAETRKLYQEILQQPPAPHPAPSAPPRPPPARRRGLRARRDTSDRPLVGRGAELARLERAIGSAWSRRGQMLLAVGEAGIGKSRLMEVLAAEAAARGGCVLAGRAYESEQLLPFQPWITALRGDQARARSEVVSQLSPGLRAELSRLFPELGDTAPAPPVGADNATRLFEAMLDLVGGMAERQPLVIILEDLHWADEMSLRLLSFLVRRVTSRGVLLAVTAREEELVGAPGLRRLVEELAAEPYFVSLKLAPLSRPETAALVRALARAGSDEEWLSGTVDQVWALSEGNPFVVVECVHALPDPSTRSEAVALPERVREVITARLERLGDRARQLAAVAAVAGRDCGFPLLQRAAGLGPADAAEALEQLVSRRLVTAAGERFELAHDRIRRVVYEGLLAPRRAALHAAVGEALEALHAGRLEEVYDQLADHYARAGIPEKAAAYLTELATVARLRYAFEEAIRVLDQAFGQTERLAGPERERRRLQLALEKARVFSGLARFREILELLIPLREQVKTLRDPALAGPYFFRLAMTHTYLGQEREAGEAAEHAAVAADRAGDRAIAGQARYVLALRSCWAGESRQGVEHARQAIALLAGSGEHLWLGLSHWVLAMNHLLLGEVAAALRAVAEAEAIGNAIDDPRLRSMAASAMGWALAARGDSNAAIEACRRAGELSRDPVAGAAAFQALGYAYLEGGDAAAARAPLEEAARQLIGFGMHQSAARSLAFLGDACLASGELARADEVAARAVTKSRESGAPWALAWAERTRGRVARARGSMEEARRQLEGALAAFTAMEARLEAARTRIDLAEVAQSLGDGPRAQSLLAEALHVFRDLDLSKHAEKAAAVGRRLGIRLGAMSG